MKRIALVAAILLVNAIPAAAHGGGDPAYRSEVTAIAPAAGVTAAVLDRDDRLRLERTGDAEVIVYGYEQEPYLRFGADGVFRNERSPATYLNDDRLGDVAVPATADAKAEPVWRRVAGGTAYEWHDHRIHWMNTTPPPAVQRDADHARTVFTWAVPLSVGGSAGSIDGRLDYTPQADNPWALWFVAASVIGLGGAVVVALLRQRLRHPAEAEEAATG